MEKVPPLDLEGGRGKDDAEASSSRPPKGDEDVEPSTSVAAKPKRKPKAAERGGEENLPPAQENSEPQAPPEGGGAKLKKKASKKKKAKGVLSKQALAELKDIYDDVAPEGANGGGARVSVLVKVLKKDGDFQALANAKDPAAFDELVAGLRAHDGKTITWEEVEAVLEAMEQPGARGGADAAPLEPSKKLETQMTGLQYTYNEVTGMLSNPGGGADKNAAVRQTYSEDAAHRLRRVYDADDGPTGLLQRIRHYFYPPPETPGADLHGADPLVLDSGPDYGVELMGVTELIGYFLDVTAVLSQSLLGGFALIHLYMTYLLNANDLPGGATDSGFLHYYSPMALSLQRTYLTLSTISLLSAVDKLTRDSVMERNTQSSCLVLIGCYLVAVILSLVNTPFEDTLYYSARRVPNYWALAPLNSNFEDRLVGYHAMNVLRQICCGIGLVVMVCCHLQPAKAAADRR